MVKNTTCVSFVGLGKIFSLTGCTHHVHVHKVFILHCICTLYNAVGLYNTVHVCLVWCNGHCGSVTLQGLLQCVVLVNCIAHRIGLGLRL